MYDKPWIGVVGGRISIQTVNLLLSMVQSYVASPGTA